MLVPSILNEKMQGAIIKLMNPIEIFSFNRTLLLQSLYLNTNYIVNGWIKKLLNHPTIIESEVQCQM